MPACRGRADRNEAVASIYPPGFLPHPQDYPLRWRRLWFVRKRTCDADLGVIFHTSHAIPVGSWIELLIPLRHELQRFRGAVVFVRRATHSHEIGVWLQAASDADRARLVERICDLEARLKHRAAMPLRPAERPPTFRDWSARLLNKIPRLVDSRFV